MRFDKQLGITRPYFPILLPDIEDNRELILDHEFKVQSFTKFGFNLKVGLHEVIFFNLNYFLS